MRYSGVSMVEAISATARSAPTIHVARCLLESETFPTCDTCPVIAVALMDYAQKMELSLKIDPLSDAATAWAVAEVY